MVPLLAFSRSDPALELRADLLLPSPGRMSLRFQLSDPDGAVLDSFEPGAYAPSAFQRADGLWRTTCLEAFFALPGQPGYWELNFSPAGRSWNLYAFHSYRSPSPPVSSRDFEARRIMVGKDSLECELEGRELTVVEASLCAVLRTRTGTHYYASRHAEEKPDFHSRESFVLRRQAG